MPGSTPLLSRENSATRAPSRPGTSASSRDVEKPSPLADYVLGECLGKGAFGSVYRAFNWGTGETVAVKQVKVENLPKSELRVIMTEIDLLKNLNHPNIVSYHGFVKTSDSLYIILEYCENGSLHSICKNFGKFPENLVGIYMTQVLHGLQYLHDQGVIHRDIKGANILTTKEGLVKLADFGVATKTGGLGDASVVGTPYWMAPEVIELAGATTASDIWSVGCTVIELIDGKPPYHKLASMPALFRIVNDDHPPLPEGASPAVRDFLMQCFQKDPNLRISAKKLLKHPWIVNSKRTDSAVRAPAMKYDEAVKSVQQWNEALRSPNAGTLKKSSKPSGSSPSARRYGELPASLITPTKAPLALPKPRVNTEAFRSPEHTQDDDNWDDDFTSTISPNGLKFPKTTKQLDFSYSLEPTRQKLSNWQEDGNDSWGDIEGGDNSGFKHQFSSSLEEDDPLQTIRPTPRQTHSRSASQPMPTRSVSPQKSAVKLPKPPSPKMGPPMPRPRKPLKRSTSLFKEDAFEDYSDLVDENDALFAKKVDMMKQNASMSPRLFHPSDLTKSLPRPSSSNGSARRKKLPDAGSVYSNPKLSQSSVEISKFAESEGEEDYSDLVAKVSGADLYDSDASIDDQSLTLNSKLSNHSWMGDVEEDWDDPFATLEEGFDETDLDANMAREKLARLAVTVDSLVGSLKRTQDEDDLDDIVHQLREILRETPETKQNIVDAHGMLPILEVLETCTSRDIIFNLLEIFNEVIFDDTEMQENLSFLGGIPIVTKFASKKYPSNIRLEAAAFVRQMLQASTLTLQMFISCGGINVLVEFLEEDYETQRELVLIAINGIWSVFQMPGPTPKNDFCRIFSRNSVLQPLAAALHLVLDEDTEIAHLCIERIVNIFYIFSKAEEHVKEMVAERSVLKSILKDLERMSPDHQIIMLRFVKNLSMLSSTLDTLQNANAIEVLADFLVKRKENPHYRECSNQITSTLYNLCKLSKSRQEEAASNGLIPILMNVVKEERPLKEFALPVICDMAHASKTTRRYLWQCKGLDFYVSLLSDANWAVTAIDAISVWLQEETARVEEKLLGSKFSSLLLKAFVAAKANNFESLLDPLRNIFRLSPSLAVGAANQELFQRLVQKLSHNKAIVRVNLLRLLRSICDASEHKESLLKMFGILPAITRVSERDQAVLVKNLASDLVRACHERERDRARTGSNRSHTPPRPGSASPTKRNIPMTPSRHLQLPRITQGQITSASSPSTPRGRQRQMSNPFIGAKTVYFDAQEAQTPRPSTSSSTSPLVPSPLTNSYPTVFHTPRAMPATPKKRITRQRTESNASSSLTSSSEFEEEGDRPLVSLMTLQRAQRTASAEDGRFGSGMGLGLNSSLGLEMQSSSDRAQRSRPASERSRPGSGGVGKRSAT